MDDPTRERVAFTLAFHAVPIIPGTAPARAAGPGQPGHLERLIDTPPVGIWPRAERGDAPIQIR